MDNLTYGKMNAVTQNAFLLGVASHVFQIKRKPSSEDLINVYRVIIAKYPFMRSPTGSPYVSKYIIYILYIYILYIYIYIYIYVTQHEKIGLMCTQNLTKLLYFKLK